MKYEVQFQLGAASYTVRGSDIDGVLTLIQRLQTDERDYVIAEAYQVVGQLLQDVGLFDSERGTKILDNLAQARIVHEDVLPWASSKPAENDGWIEWGGGNRPVAADAQVLVRMRDGSETRTALSACYLHWDHRNSRTDIVAYKVVKP